MKKQTQFFILLLICFQTVSAQTITFISDRNNKPVSKVSVFGKDGSVLAFSDIDGKIDRKSIDPSLEKFQLIHDNVSIATFSYKDFSRDTIKINDQVKDLETVVIKRKKAARYIILKGNFTSYATSNGKLSSYSDGVAIYIYDNKTEKLKKQYVQQYRMFRVEDREKRTKAMATREAYAGMPRLYVVYDLEKLKSGRLTSTFKYSETDKSDMVEIKTDDLRGNEIKLLGYTLRNTYKTENVSYKKGTEKTLKNILEYTDFDTREIKHKSETQYTVVNDYYMLYPTEISYSDDDDIEHVNFDKDYSKYTTKFWETPAFPKLLPTIAPFYKEKLTQEPAKN